jgi:hypothetical protein
MKAPLRHILRLVLQFFAGLGLLFFCNRVYFVMWDNYFPMLPRPCIAMEFVGTTEYVTLLIGFVFCQVLAYAGMRVLWKSN